MIDFAKDISKLVTSIHVFKPHLLLHYISMYHITYCHNLKGLFWSHELIRLTAPHIWLQYGQKHRMSFGKEGKMGLTHYWEREIELPIDLMGKAAEDCNTLFGNIEMGLAGSGGKGEPVLNSEMIVFNGADDSACEDFSFPRTHIPRRARNKSLGYCKTEYMPYDLCVQTALIILKHHLGEMVTVASDASDEDWKKAKDVCQENLGYGSDFELGIIS